MLRYGIGGCFRLLWVVYAILLWYDLQKQVNEDGALAMQENEYFRELRKKAEWDAWANEKWYRKIGLLLYRWVLEPALSILKLIGILLLAVLVPLILLAITEGVPPWWKLL